MDLHIYRNSQDRWHDLRNAARERGAVLAVNAFTFDELVERLTPGVNVATAGERCVLLLGARAGNLTNAQFPIPNSHPMKIDRWELNIGQILGPRYAYDALSELKAARVRPHELRAAGADALAGMLEGYDRGLSEAGLLDPQDRCVLAASRVAEGAVAWLKRFERVVLHALYDLSESQFMLVRSLIETLPDGGTVVLFNTTTNVKPTQFAEWTWQRFIQDESLAEKTFPEFCRPSNRTRAVLDKLFVFDPHDALPPDDSVRIVEAPTRYKEAEKIGGDIAALLAGGKSPNDIAVVVRHLETYGEMLEDVFTRYEIPYRFETGVPLLRIPFIKYWLALLDLVTSERSREALARAMSSVYFSPRLSPATDVERALAQFGYIDRNHLRASSLAARKNSPLTSEIQRLEGILDELEHATGSIAGFLARLPTPMPRSERDRQAWRVLLEELTAVSAIVDRRGSGGLRFEEFRRIASEIAGLRSVERQTSSTTPPGLPRVRIAHPSSLGARSYEWIFAPGFSDGEFPARSFSNPLLPDATVEAINKRIRPRRLVSARDRSRREPLYLFMILDSATSRATLTYPAGTLEGDPIYPSMYIGEVARHFAESPIERAARGPARSDGEWRSRVAEEWQRGRFQEDRARVLLGADVVERAKLEAKGPLRARLSRGALSLDGVWHPSELNSLSSCPFVFLARHRLGIRPLETPDFEVPAMEIGILAHTILRDFHSQAVPQCADEARARMNDIIARRLSAADVSGQGPYSVFDPSLWKIRRRQLVSVLSRYIDFAVRDARDGFQTQPEYLDSALPPAALGGTVLAGKPDHVAVLKNGSAIAAIRIDDFKYSAASSAAARQLKQSFQIPVYAYLAAQALGAEAGVRIDGRYLLLRSPGNPVLSHAIDEGVFEEVRERIGELLAKVREGAVEPDPADRQACTTCDYRRLCRFFGR
jgi:hypothetical protein